MSKETGTPELFPGFISYYLLVRFFFTLIASLQLKEYVFNNGIGSQELGLA